MPADLPTILATSGGIGEGRRTRFSFTALTDFAVDLSGVTGRSPRVCVLATAMGDDKAVLHCGSRRADPADEGAVALGS